MSYHTHKWKTPLAKKGKARIAQEKWRRNEGYSYWQKKIFPKIPYQHIKAGPGARPAGLVKYHTAPVASREERWRKWKYDMQHDIPWAQSSVKKTNWANYYGRKYYRK